MQSIKLGFEAANMSTVESQIVTHLNGKILHVALGVRTRLAASPSNTGDVNSRVWLMNASCM